MNRGQCQGTLRTLAGAYNRRIESDLEYLRIYNPDVTAKPPKATKCSDYINRITQGMQAKKYKGGKAARIKAQTSRLFESYFKPLPQ